MLLPKIIGKFKMITAKKINEIKHRSGSSVWQRDYYEHVIRNGESLIHISDYIVNNPLNWDHDDYFYKE